VVFHFKYSKQIAFFCLFLFFSFCLFAQQQVQPAFRRCLVKTLNFEQGLMNNGTYNIITDVKGFTWVSTETGIQRYNGYNFEKVLPVINNKDTININSPAFFFGLNNNNIWICHKHGILEYSPITNSFKKISQINSYRVDGYYSTIPLKETAEGIWCLQEGKGVVIYNHEGAIVSRLSVNIIPFCDTVTHYGISLLTHATASNDNFIFIQNHKKNLLRIDLHTREEKMFDLNTDDIVNIACSDQWVYVISPTSLFAIEPNSGEIKKRKPVSEITSDPVGYLSLEVNDSKQLLVGVNGHLVEMDTSFNHFTEFITLDRKPIVAAGGLNFTYADKFKRLWLLTNDDIKRVKNIEIPFQHFLYKNEKNNFVRCLYFDEKKHILFAGCYNGGIQLYDTLGNELWQKSLITDSVKDIMGIEKFDENLYLIITLRKGFWWLRLKEQKLEKVLFANGVYLPSIDNNQYPDNCQRINDSTIYFASYDNVYRCVFRKEKLVQAKPLLPVLPNMSNNITSFYFASDSTLWAGTRKGLIYFLSKKGDFHTNQIPENYAVRSSTEDIDHNIWMGADKGVYIFSSTGKLIRAVTRESGLLNDCEYALLPLSNQPAVFSSSNLGLAYISSSGVVKNFTKEMGLQENEFNTNACIKTRSGKFYFGGVNGITAFYPEDLSAIKDTPILNITRLVINDIVFDFQKGFWNSDSILLNYDQDHLQFDFAALGLLNTNEYNYKYRVNNFEQTWQTSNHPTDIRYTLEPGKYILEIYCSPILSSNSVVFKKIFIIITPPWWQTWWFRAMAFVTLVSLVSFVVWQYNHQKFQDKIRSLQLQNELQKDRERISRELHDNIGTQLSYINSNVDWLLEAPVEFSKEEERKRLSVVNDTAKNLVSDLRETIWAIKKESIQLDELADKVKSFLQSQCIVQPQLEMFVKENIEKNVKLSPTEALNIFRVCQEAIMNSIKHSNAGKISLSIRSDKIHDFDFVIEDDGKGFKLNGHIDGHYGMENMKHRADELGASLQISSNTGKGTKINFSRNA